MKKDGWGPNLPHACGHSLKKLAQKDTNVALNLWDECCPWNLRELGVCCCFL